jgi:beta-phosphoglucomutase
VILDMDGIIIDSEPVYRLAWQQAAAELGYDLSDEFYGSLLGLTTPDAEAKVYERFGPEFPISRFRELWPARWRRLVETKGIPVKPGLGNFLKVLEEHRLPVAVGTSSEAELVATSLRAAGLDGRFACIVSGDQVANGKPAPDIFLEAARRLGVTPGRCIVLEDSDAGILAAAAAGMASIIIPDLKPPSPEAAKIALRILPSLDEAAAFIKGWSR